jgi:hypothetical protein
MTSPPTPIDSAATPSSADGLHVVSDLALPGIWIYLRLQFWDPEHVARDFPANLEVRVAGLTYRTQAGGRLSFPIPRLSPPDQFTLEFPAASPRFVICEPVPGSPPIRVGSPPSYPRLADAAPDTLERYFALPMDFASPPAPWGLRHSDWTVLSSPPPNATYANGLIRHRERNRPIGSPAQPMILVLDPHWHFFRFEFFDRAFGYSTGANGHNRNRVCIPPVGLEGFRENPNPNNMDIANTHSNWVIGSPNERLQCLPWILQRNTAGSALPSLTGQPVAGKATSLRFHLPNQSYIFSKSQAEREIQEVTDVAKLEPGPGRLKYYDLPEWWKSKNYFARPTGGPAKFFRELTAAEIGNATDRTKYIAFSLDDLVLYRENAGAIQPLDGYTANDRVVLFHHKFDNSVAGSTNHGIFRPMAPGDANALTANLPCSNVAVAGRGASPPGLSPYYIFDYPDWTRLVVTQGNLFDVFDRRCPDDNSADAVVGARAAVRWRDGTGPPGVNTKEWDSATDTWPACVPGTKSQPFVEFDTVPTRVDIPGVLNPGGRALFSFQPFYHLRMPRTAMRYNPAEDSQIGRFDIALLRCCDVDANGDEIAVNLHYIKSRFDLSNAATVAELGGIPLTRREWAQAISINVANRWNGNDAVNNCRVQLLPRISPPAPLKVHVVWFAQSVRFEHAHSNIWVLPSTGARDNRHSLWGMGNTSANTYEAFWNGSFTTAHESGHMNGHPDDYNERWDAASYANLSFRTLHAGDPFEPDDGVQTGGAADGAMMNRNMQLRNRYYWHAAEWVRLITDIRLKVYHRHTTGAVYQYWLPEYPPANVDMGRNYYSWPYGVRLASILPAPAFASPPLIGTASPPGGLPRDQFDQFLYVLGVDRYSAELLQKPGAVAPFTPFDGILVIVVRLKCELPANRDFDTEGTTRRQLLANIASFANQFLNRKWYAEGRFGSPAGQYQFTRCLLHFAPQYLVSNHPFFGPTQTSPIGRRVHSVDSELSDVDPARAAAFETEYGFNFDLNVVFDAGGPSASWDPDPARRRLLVRYNAVADMQTIMNAHFPTFLGLPGIDVGHLTTNHLERVAGQILQNCTVRAL